MCSIALPIRFPRRSENELTIVCAIKYNQRGDDKTIMQIIPVAANFGDKGLNPKTSLLPTAETSQVEGVKVELHGPAYKEQDQTTVIDLTCDRSVEVYFLSRFLFSMDLTVFALFLFSCSPYYLFRCFPRGACLPCAETISLSCEVLSGWNSL